MTGEFDRFATIHGGDSASYRFRQR
jgi:hypothetical protein